MNRFITFEKTRNLFGSVSINIDSVASIIEEGNTAYIFIKDFKYQTKIDEVHTKIVVDTGTTAFNNLKICLGLI